MVNVYQNMSSSANSTDLGMGIFGYRLAGFCGSLPTLNRHLIMLIDVSIRLVPVSTCKQVMVKNQLLNGQ